MPLPTLKRDEAGKALSLEEQQSRIWDAWREQFPQERGPEPISEGYIAEMYDDHVIIEISGEHWKIPYAADGDTVTFAPRDEWQKVKQERNWIAAKNALKAISRTEDELRVGNYIVVFGGRDLEGVKPLTTETAWLNPDGSRGEYFSPDTDLTSLYTKAGVLYQDWEHAQGEAGDDLLGIVDWKTARIDDKGVFVERVLQRRNRYVQWLEELGWFDDGTLGTSSHADPHGIEKAADGQITRWPLQRDTITVNPMEPRMLQGNQLQAFKALGIPVPTNTAGEPEQAETAPEADPSAVAVAKARARLQLLKLSLEEQR